MSRINEALKHAGGLPVPSSGAPNETANLAFPEGADAAQTRSNSQADISARHEATSQSAGLSQFAESEGEERPALEPEVNRQPEVRVTAAAPLPTVNIRKPDPAFAERLTIDNTISPVSIEQYRQLAGVLHQLQADRGTRIVMIASAQMGDGKSLTAVNLALTLSESYRRQVLLVDADLRRPTLERVFAVEGGPGLSEGLKAGPAAPISATALTPYLSFLPGGQPDPDPMASLTSGHIRGILEKAASNFDWVILDTPPVCLLPDAHLLTAMVDAVVLVIGAGSTPLPLVERAIEIIGRDRIVGVVLN